MKDLVTLVSGIEFKTRALAARFEAISKENEELKKKINSYSRHWKSIN